MNSVSSKRIVVTQDLLKSLSGSLASGHEQVQAGDVFHGVLSGVDPGTEFGVGVPHYGVARRRVMTEGAMPLVSLAPVTSKKNSQKGVMVLPEGTLPPKKNVGPLKSYVLLFLRPVRIPRRKIDDGSFRRRTRLSDEKVEEMRKILLLLRLEGAS